MYCYNNPMLYYGIPIPIDNSELYQYVLKQLISKYKKSYTFECQDDIDDFLMDMSLEADESIDISFGIQNIEFTNLNNEFKPINSKSILILSGDHKTSNLYSTPFESKKECIEFYKQEFSNILPKNFDYENNIGTILYVS